MVWDRRGQLPPAQRGYDATHRAAREQWAKLVRTGAVCCVRCGKPVAPWQSWHLDHDDNDRRIYRGVSHASCNLKAGARRGRAIQTGATFDGRVVVSREW
jgi:hypothetical protein